MAIKINLMPDKFVQGWRERFPGPSFILATSVFFVIALFIYLGIFIYQNYSLKEKIREAGASNNDLNAEISKNLNIRFIDANHRAKDVKKILGSRLYWTSLYKIIESRAVNGVLYKDFSAAKSESDNDVIEAEIGGSADNFTALAKQLAAFRDSKEIKSADFGKAELDKNGRVAFTINLRFSAAALK